jgi:hypothetical protein
VLHNCVCAQMVVRYDLLLEQLVACVLKDCLRDLDLPSDVRLQLMRRSAAQSSQQSRGESSRSW